VTLAQLLEQYVSLGIFLVALGLGLLSFVAWRRERDRRMGIVTAGYAMFAVYGLVVFLEYFLLPYVPYRLVELLEHGSAILILGGLLAFFVALTRD
jgi:CHASE2 domain-containing sensor protein